MMSGSSASALHVTLRHTLRPVVPHFQLIQSFQKPSGAVCHGQSPAELGADRLGHFRLYFRLSHDGERR